MSGDEVLALSVCVAVALAGAWFWYRPLLRATTLAGGVWLRFLLGLVPPAGLALLYVVLARYAAREVRERPEYLVLFLFGGAAWMALGAMAMPLLGVSLRDDAVENRNAAATAVACGAAWGMLLCFAGANAGEGETIWTTFIPAAAESAVLLALWALLEVVSGVSEAVTIDRDAASGLRLAGLLVGCGLILGRAGAGNWHGAADALRDLGRIGWPAAALTCAAAVMQGLLRPTPHEPRPGAILRGAVPAAAYVAAAAAYVLALGYHR